MILNVVIILVALLLLRSLYNLYYWMCAKRYYNKYMIFVKEQKDWYIREHRQQIIKLLQKAGIKDSFRSNVEPAGWGMLETGQISVFRNLSTLREDIVTIVNGDFREAIGVFRQRIFESINPIYWIETFFQLPKIMLEFLGVNPASLIIRMLLLFWWIFCAVSTIIGVLFNKEFTTWIMQYIK